jgi:hypothetical protein
MLSALAVLCACGLQERSGVETTNGIEVALLDSKGAKASGARVYAVAKDTWFHAINQGNSPILDSGITDKQGHVTLVIPDSNEFSIEAYREADAVRIESISGTLAQTSLLLQTSAQLSGTAQEPNSVVYLAGTHLSVMSDAQGRYVFSQVPAGSYGVVVKPRGASASLESVVNLASGDVQVQPLQATNPDRLLLEDFSDRNRMHRFSNITGGGTWFWTSDNSSSIVPFTLGQQSDFSLALTDSTAWSGVSAHIQVTLGKSSTARFANIGVNMRTGSNIQDSARQWVNLCNLDTLVFWAKGSGSVIVQWTTPLYLQNPAQPILYSALFVLPIEWQRVAISADNILPMDSRNVVSNVAPWSTACSQTRNLTFTFDNDSDFWLDDLTLVGHGIQDWVFE